MRPARWGSGFLRSGIHPGASPPVCFAAPPLAVFGCAKRSLRSHPRINPSTQPSDVARGSRSKAAAELTLILLSGEKHKRCAFCPIVGGWLASDGGLTADQSPTEYTQSNCGSWLASDGGRPADQSLTECTRSNCGSQPAGDGGLIADQSPSECTRSNCGSELARESGLPNTITFRPATKKPEAFAVRALKIKRSQPSAAPTQSLFRSCGRLQFFYFVMGSLPVITNLSNTFCPSRAACRTSRNVSSSRAFCFAGFRAEIVLMLAGLRD